jgi:hypothetical protein
MEEAKIGLKKSLSFFSLLGPLVKVPTAWISVEGNGNTPELAVLKIRLVITLPDGSLMKTQI